MKLRIALIGYGKMGKAVEAECLLRGHEIILCAGRDNLHEATILQPDTCDCFIEFTRPEAAVAIYRSLIPTGIPIVAGTTGWLANLPAIAGEVEAAQGAFMHSSNFSVGVNILFQLNKQLAKLMNGYPDYDVFVTEAHHRHKKDAPSGTANTLSQQILADLDRKTKVADAEFHNRAPEPHELSVASTRAGEIIGQHEVTYISEIDRITIAHEAFNRRGFALGAVLGAEWIFGKRGVFEFSEIFS